MFAHVNDYELGSYYESVANEYAYVCDQLDSVDPEKDYELFGALELAKSQLEFIYGIHEAEESIDYIDDLPF
jgi:hypothetical protein